MGNYRYWIHRDYSLGGPPVTEWWDTTGLSVSPGHFRPGQRLTVLRTRLQVWAWWASNVAPLPAPQQTAPILKAKVQYWDAETGNYPPPTNWPDDLGDSPEFTVLGRPTIRSALKLLPSTWRAPNGTEPQVFYGGAVLDGIEGESEGKRKSNGELMTVWLALAQGDNGNWSYVPNWATGIPFNFRAVLSCLMEQSWLGG